MFVAPVVVMLNQIQSRMRQNLESQRRLLQFGCRSSSPETLPLTTSFSLGCRKDHRAQRITSPESLHTLHFSLTLTGRPESKCVHSIPFSNVEKNDCLDGGASQLFQAIWYPKVIWEIAPYIDIQSYTCIYNQFMCVSCYRYIMHLVYIYMYIYICVYVYI